MEKRTREIVALVLLVALGAVAAGAMGWYLLVGHNWNMAASHIDDLVGSMDGYTVVVYEGTLTEEQRDQGAVRELVGSNGEIAGPASEDAEGGQVAGPASAAREAQPASGSDVLGQAAGRSRAQGAAAGAGPAVTSAEIAASYRDKGAAVVTVDIAHPAQYEDPVVVWKGSQRIGIVYVAAQNRLATLRAKLRSLESAAVDLVIVVLDSPVPNDAVLNGADLAVFACDAGIAPGGEWAGRAFCVDSPLAGEVQAVIMAPSGVMTAKTVVSPERP